jgi:heat shock protein HslJ
MIIQEYSRMVHMAGYTIVTILVLCLAISVFPALAENTPLGSYIVTEIRDEAGALIKHSDLSRITATIDGLNISGSAGCNQYKATIAMKDGAITISAPTATLKYCQPEVMKEESQYLKNLEKIVHYKIVDDNLLLFDVENHPVISLTRYVEKKSVPFPYDTPFILTRIFRDDQLKYAFLALKTLIEFHPDGTFTGNGGCNEFSGTYNLTANTITFNPVTITKKACNKSRLNQEQSLLDIMKGTLGYEIRNDQVILMNDAGVVVAEWKEYDTP